MPKSINCQSNCIGLLSHQDHHYGLKLKVFELIKCDQHNFKILLLKTIQYLITYQH